MNNQVYLWLLCNFYDPLAVLYYYPPTLSQSLSALQLQTYTYSYTLAETLLGLPPVP